VERYNLEIEEYHAFSVEAGRRGAAPVHNGRGDDIKRPAEPLMITPGGSVIPEYAGGKTSGVLSRPGGGETTILSGVEGPSKGTTGIPGMHNRIKTHVEAHAAVILRRERLTEATLYINRAPCPTSNPRSPGCFDNLPKMLPEGARLRVIGPDGFDHTFVGLPDPPETVITGL
jgi:SCP1.201-like deaminase